MKKISDRFPILLTAYCLVMAFLLVISVVCLRGLFASSLQNQLLNYGQITLDSDVLYIDTMFNSVKEVFDGISFDNEINRLLNYDNVNANELNNGIKRLQSYTDMSVFIDSIYILNQRTGLIYSSSANSPESVFNKDSFFDSDAVGIMEEYYGYKNMQPIFRVLDSNYPYSESKDYVSFLRFNTLQPKGQSNVLMINVSQDILTRLMVSVPREGNRLLLLTGDNRTYTAISGNLENYDDKIVRELLSDISGKEGGLFKKLDGKNYIVCHKDNSVFGLKTIYITDESSIGGLSKAKEYESTILVLAVVFAICSVAILYLIRRLLLINRNHNQSVQHLMAETRRKGILTLLNSGRDDISFPEMESLGIAINEFADIRILVISVDSLFHKTFSSDSAELKRRILGFVGNYDSPFCSVLNTYDDEDKCIMVFEDVDDSISFNMMLKKLKAEMQKEISQSLTFVVSENCDIYQISETYKDLCSMISYRLLLGDIPLITPEQIRRREDHEFDLSDFDFKKACDAVMRQDMSLAISEIRDCLAVISKGTFKGFQLNLMRLTMMVDDAVKKILSNNGIEDSIHFDSIYNDLFSFSSIESIICFFEDSLDKVNCLISSSKNNRQINLVSEMQSIVEQSFRRKDFSIIAVADEIGMSASYLGKLFKKNVGQTFIEYVQDKRMSTACEELANTDDQIIEIISNVGFSDVQYFYKVFKKHYGCTPMKYRQQHRN